MNKCDNDFHLSVWQRSLNALDEEVPHYLLPTETEN